MAAAAAKLASFANPNAALADAGSWLSVFDDVGAATGRERCPIGQSELRWCCPDSRVLAFGHDASS